MNGLLPKNYEKAFRREKFARLIVAGLLYVSFVFALGISFLAPSYFVLKFSLEDTLRQLDTEELSLRRRNADNLEKSVSSLNLLLRDYNRNELRKFSFSNVLVKIINSAPDGININSVDFDKNQDNLFFFRISGEADFREDIINYQRNLKTLSEVSEVRSPLANLLKDANAPFILEADIKKEFYGQK